MSERKYWFAMPRRPAEMTKADLGRFTVPLGWQGRVLILGAVIAPIIALLVVAPLLVGAPDWVLFAVLGAICFGDVVGYLLIARAKTDPVRGIDDYRAAKGKDPSGGA